MPEIKNARPRFGLEGQLLYDYVAKDYVRIGTMVECPEGVWDTVKVRDLILADKPIEAALNTRPSMAVDKVAQANDDFVKTTDALSVSDGVALDSVSHPAPNQLGSDEPAEFSADSIETVEIDVQAPSA